VGCLTAFSASGVDSPREKLEFPSAALPSAGVFRFGRLTASVRSNDATFAWRFGRIFHDCREQDAFAGASSELAVFVPREGEHVVARISGHQKLDAEVSQALLPGVAISSCGDRIVIAKRAAWPIFLSHYFVHHVMALQTDVLFLHGATVDVGGRGLFLGGGKGAGKSTLALALGARGHCILGDEVAAIQAADLECLPFRRAVSIREGPQARAVQDFLAKWGAEPEQLADGTTRRRVPISEIFPESRPRGVKLDTAVFLRGFGGRQEVEPLEFAPRHAEWLGPLFATFASRPAGLAAIDLIRLFSRTRCYRVMVAGGPEQTAECIEAIVEGKWG
jgi:hypothetical protein